MNKNNTKQQLASNEYTRLIELYKKAGVDDIKLKINNSLIHKVAKLYAYLESIKDKENIIAYKSKGQIIQEETVVGKSRVKYMAQYVNAMQKLNKNLLGVVAVDDSGLSEFE